MKLYLENSMVLDLIPNYFLIHICKVYRLDYTGVHQ